jgi:hypothetical protein
MPDVWLQRTEGRLHSRERSEQLYAPATTRQRYKLFWATSNTFLARLYSSPLITISAIRGAYASTRVLVLSYVNACPTMRIVLPGTVCL